MRLSCSHLSKLAAMGARHGWQAVEELPREYRVATADATVKLMAYYVTVSNVLTSPAQQSALLARAVSCFFDAAPRFAAASVDSKLDYLGSGPLASAAGYPGGVAGEAGEAEKLAAEGEVLAQLREVLLQWLKVLAQQKPALMPPVKSVYRIALLAAPGHISEAMGAQLNVVEGCPALKAMLGRPR
jgi:hypothetical protein